mmetsp:Transcript_10606/g.26748  ORF Transcript_10606/g.26748 Transcript_10606/m.26748 type:complete len:281 (+) Transcript_10606:1861-2703(+)
MESYWFQTMPLFRANFSKRRYSSKSHHWLKSSDGCSLKGTKAIQHSKVWGSEAGNKIVANTCRISGGAARNVRWMQHISTASVTHHHIEEGSVVSVRSSIEPWVQKTEGRFVLVQLTLVQQADDTSKDRGAGTGSIRWLQVVTSPNKKIMTNRSHIRIGPVARIEANRKLSSIHLEILLHVLALVGRHRVVIATGEASAGGPHHSDVSANADLSCGPAAIQVHATEGGVRLADRCGARSVVRCANRGDPRARCRILGSQIAGGGTVADVARSGVSRRDHH